jgi:serine/threonine protein kinase/WD40 repeat protein
VVALADLTNVHTLADLVEQGHVLSEGEAVELVRQVAVELVPLHRAGKAHGRISPATILVDEVLQARLQHSGGDSSVEQSGFSDEWIPREVRDRAFARMMERLEGKPAAGDVYASSASATAGEACTDPRQIDVYGLAAILCRLITGKSADAYLRSPRVKGSLTESRQQFFERALGCIPGPRLRDADDFLLALEAPLTRVMAPAARRAGEGSASPAPQPYSEVLEAIDLSPSCRSGLPISLPDEALHDDEDLPFSKLGHFDIISRLGHGGMGEVYLGYDSGLDRRVAIKVLPADLARDPDLVRRFRAEATAAARLIHPNIIQIHFIGEDSGHQFFAMQYVEGMSLAQYLARGNRPTIEQSLAIIDEVLSGLVAAHRLGFVHRDIKPGNILLDSVHRRALLADFGLVKSLEDTSTTRTSAGAVLGTADYSSPEQGLGQAVDFRSDLYSSGVVLYQLLCGRLPFIGKETTTVIYQHVHEPPPLLSRLAPTVPAPLIAIVERLLAKSPDDRYQSAADVLAELRAVRAGQPTGVFHHAGGRDIPAVERHASPSRRLVDTSPAISQPTLTLPAARGAGGAPPDKGRRRVLLALAGAALPAVAGGMWFALTPESQRPRWLAALTGRRQNETGEIRQFADHGAEINSLILTSDEELLFAGDRTGKLHVWDFRMGEKRKTIRAHSGPIRRLKMSGDGRFVVSASADQTLKMWNVSTWKPVTQCNGHVDIVSSVAPVPGREEIVSSSFDGTLIRWQIARGNLMARYGSVLDENSAPSPQNVDLQSLDRHITWVRDIAIPEPGNRIYSAGNEGVVFVWDLESARVIGRLLGNAGVVMCLAASPDGTRLLTGSYQKVLCLWDLTKNELVHRIPHDSATPACVVFSPNGRLALSGGADGVIHVYEVHTGRELHQLEGHEGTATSVQFLADGRRVVSSGEDRTIRVWKLPAEIA